MGFGERDEGVDPGLDLLAAAELWLAAQGLAEVLAGPLEDRDQERVPVGEVVVEQAAGDAGAAGDIVDRQLVGRPDAEQLDAGAQQLFAARVAGKSRPRLTGPGHTVY